MQIVLEPQDPQIVCPKNVGKKTNVLVNILKRCVIDKLLFSQTRFMEYNNNGYINPPI